MTDDDRYDDAELAEAQALADALERAERSALPGSVPDGRAPADSVADALDTADLIAAAALPGLSPARSDAVMSRVQARLRSKRQRRSRNLALAAIAGTLAAAAAALLLVQPGPMADGKELESDRVPPTLSSARMEAARAQRAWLDDPTALRSVDLQRRLADYRSAHFAELERSIAP